MWEAGTRVQVWVWVGLNKVRWEGKVGITGCRGREGGHELSSTLINPSHLTEKWADFSSCVVGEDYRLGKQGEK